MKLDDLPPRLRAQAEAQLSVKAVAPRLHNPQPKPVVQLPALEAGENEKGGGGRFRVRITRCGAKLLDPDNLAGAKLLVDQLRYAGLIPEDNPAAIELELAQVKAPKAERGTLVEVVKIPT